MLFRFDPERVHHATLAACRIPASSPAALAARRRPSGTCPHAASGVARSVFFVARRASGQHSNALTEVHDRPSNCRRYRRHLYRRHRFGSGRWIGGLGKALSTPDDLVEGMLQAIHHAGAAPSDADFIIHGSTVAINAILERKGAQAALITTAGFATCTRSGGSTGPIRSTSSFASTFRWFRANASSKSPNAARRRHRVAAAR